MLRSQPACAEITAQRTGVDRIGGQKGERKMKGKEREEEREEKGETQEERRTSRAPFGDRRPSDVTEMPPLRSAHLRF